MGKIRDSNELSIIRDRIATSIKTINSSMDVQTGHVIRDIVVDAPGQEFRYAYVLLDYVNTIKSLDGITTILGDDGYREDLRLALGFETSSEVDTLISADLSDLSSVFGVTRKAAISARYMQRFYRTDNNSGNVLTIPVGTSVKTADGSVIAVVLASSAQIPILDTVNGLYYVEEVVTATIGGTVGNLSLGSLKQISPQITQASSTTNVTLLTSGVDIETDLAIIDRVRQVRKGRNLQTKSGLLNVALGTSEDSPLSFQDAILVDPSNSLMTRAYAGAIDIYVVGKNIQYVQERIYHEGSGTVYTLGYQPVNSVTSVDGSTSGLLTSVTTLDASSSVWGSTRAYTRVEVAGGVVGEILTVTYRVDQAIIDAQRLFDSDEDYTVPAADILFRQGSMATIDLSVKVYYFGQRAQADVEDDIESDLAAFFSGGTTSNSVRLTAKRLGEDIDWSDVASIITSVSDVDRITLAGTNGIRFYKNSVQTYDDPISIADNEYARLGTVVFL